MAKAKAHDYIGSWFVTYTEWFTEDRHIYEHVEGPSIGLYAFILFYSDFTAIGGNLTLKILFSGPWLYGIFM